MEHVSVFVMSKCPWAVPKKASEPIDLGVVMSEQLAQDLQVAEYGGAKQPSCSNNEKEPQVFQPEPETDVASPTVTSPGHDSDRQLALRLQQLEVEKYANRVQLEERQAAGSKVQVVHDPSQLEPYRAPASSPLTERPGAGTTVSVEAAPWSPLGFNKHDRKLKAAANRSRLGNFDQTGDMFDCTAIVSNVAYNSLEQKLTRKGFAKVTRFR